MEAKEAKEHKKHQRKQSGPQADRKKNRKHGTESEKDARKRNPKAFAVQSAVRMARTFHRSVLVPACSLTCRLARTHAHTHTLEHTSPYSCAPYLSPNCALFVCPSICILLGCPQEFIYLFLLFSVFILYVHTSILHPVV